MQTRRTSENPRPTSGFTLWELLCSVSVAAVVLGLGAPAMQNIVLDARLSATVRSFVSAVQFARAEAAKRGRGVILCQSSDQRRCSGATDYASGWIVVASDPQGPLERAPGDDVLRVDAPRLAGSILANRTAFEFRPHLKRSTNGTLTFCDRRGAAYARAVVVSYTGRPRITSQGPGQRPISCPETG